MDYSNQLDYLDKEILRLLIKDARIPYTDMAKKLKSSNSLIHQRINKMKKLGLIEGSGIKVNPSLLGFQTCSYTGIVLKEARLSQKVAKALERVPEVVECHFVSGNYALFIKIYTKDNDHLRKVLYNAVHPIDGVSSTDTFISFESFFDREVPV